MKIYKLQKPTFSIGEEKIFAQAIDDPADMFMLNMERKYLRWFPNGCNVAYVYAEQVGNSLEIHKKAPWSE